MEKENTELHDKVNLLVQEKVTITRELEKAKVSITHFDGEDDYRTGCRNVSHKQGHPTAIFEKYLFGRLFEI